MRRDMDLVRSILMATAESPDQVSIDNLIDENHDRKIVGYHISIMEDAGLIRAMIQAADNDPYYFCVVTGLTWAGNDFLDAVSSDTVWRKVRSAIANTIGSATFDVVKSAASKVGQSLVLSQLGIN